MTFQEAAKLGKGRESEGDVADALQPVADAAGGIFG